MRVIRLTEPALDEEMLAAAREALLHERGVLGESVAKFEEEFARFVGARHAVSVGSGTAALHFALLALLPRPGARVVVPAASFIASANAALHAGHEATFADVDRAGHLTPGTLAAAARGASAVVPVHLYGTPCDLPALAEAARSRGLAIVEDACQAHGARVGSRFAGTFGDAGCFSFYPTKNLSVAGDGGMVVTDRDDVADSVRSLRDCGRRTRYEHVRLGYTSRLNTVNAAIGRVQLRRLPAFNERRRRIAARYRERLPESVLLPSPPDREGVHHLFVIRSPGRDALAARLRLRGIETGVHYPIPLHLQPVYRERYGSKEGALPEAEALARECLSLPMHPGLSDEDVDAVAGAVLDVLDRGDSY